MAKRKDFWTNIGIPIIIPFLTIVGVVGVLSIFRTFNKETEDKSQTMVKIDSQNSSYSSFDIFYDSETKVMYIINYHGGVTVMLNPDGTPRLYEGGTENE